MKDVKSQTIVNADKINSSDANEEVSEIYPEEKERIKIAVAKNREKIKCNGQSGNT